MNNDNKILNPVTNRWVLKTGKIGKKLVMKKVTKTNNNLVTFKEMYNKLSRGGKLLGEGREGAVYDLGNKVIKISRSSSTKKPFGPGQLRRIGREFEVAEKAGNKGIGPIVYKYGFSNLYNGGQVSYMIMQKMVLPPSICNKINQLKLFDLYMELSKMKYGTNDYNINNIMFDPVLKEFRLIDFGRIKEYKTIKLAKQANLSVLISICRTIMGKSVQSSICNWRCDNIKPLLEKIYKESDVKRRKYMKTVLNFPCT